ncbi:leucine-rich repeat-domain-containing protein [Kockiozyma suomiensis]|uniref:leucine-rich repeat-domain-containing protein n=1 Tax=Kockiozyma suomiensis TaxID=1337062 RepID=UPI003342E8DE
MRLTVDLIDSSPSFINPLKDRELSLRGHRISMLENLGATKDLNDTIDLTDNDLTSLSNLPRLVRLRRLFLARNKLMHISPTVASSVPNMTTLVLTSNSIANLSDLIPLQACSKLTYLTLIGNPVTRKENYRLYTIWRIPSVRILDFEKVKKLEREQAEELFGTHDSPTELATTLSTISTVRTFDLGNKREAEVDSSRDVRIKLTAVEREKIIAQLKNAKSLAEIERLEQSLRRLEG